MLQNKGKHENESFGFGTVNIDSLFRFIIEYSRPLTSGFNEFIKQN